MPRKRSAISSSFGELLAGRVPLAACPLVQPLRERLGEPVGERLRHDRAVVVVLGLEPRRELVGAGSATANAPTGRRGRSAGDEVGEGAVRPRVAVRRLLAQHREPDARAVRARCRRPPRAPARSRRRRAPDEPSPDDLVEQRRRVVVQLARRRLLEDRREAPLQLPGVEEERPVDVARAAPRRRARRRACR